MADSEVDNMSPTDHNSQASGRSLGPHSPIQPTGRRSTLSLSNVEVDQNDSGDDAFMSLIRQVLNSAGDANPSGLAASEPNTSNASDCKQSRPQSDQIRSQESRSIRSPPDSSLTQQHDSDPFSTHALTSTGACHICPDPPATLISLLCGHAFCRKCLNRLFKEGTANRRSFPPKCCPWSSIRLTAVQMYLDDDVLHRYNDVHDEFSDLDPVYCANKHCSSYIRQSRTNHQHGRSMMCGSCGTYTCVDCKQPRDEHVNHNGLLKCKRPEQLMSTADSELAYLQGWKQCPRCKNLIERIEGCNRVSSTRPHFGHRRFTIS
ncbi:hypothetical protein EDD36DRAFT_4065 [Exophiala viscosa]|uniref:RBR-type E3 ubiquitin transferase n=1 Tax=Exophiala viscosa TaxID=2486360 RepID=A0AAN6E637_9EURO|nr:hypothetical protein EDD36DRAFT_4065 [Exophiala viscosa]